MCVSVCVYVCVRVSVHMCVWPGGNGDAGMVAWCTQRGASLGTEKESTDVEERNDARIGRVRAKFEGRETASKLSVSRPTERVVGGTSAEDGKPESSRPVRGV